MLDKEIVSKIKQIQIYSSHVVNTSFAGQYESVFKGRGMQFDEVREYVPGDDVRDIDWNVTARAGKPYIKRFREEREMTVLLMIDLSGSGEFGTKDRFKNELAAEFCAVLAFAAVRNNDKVGLVIFTDQIELYVPPKKGVRHMLRMIREILGFKTKGFATDISGALAYAARVTKKRATVFLVSDFISEDSDFSKEIGLVRRKHDLIAVRVTDPLEHDLPSLGIIELIDPETGQVNLIDTSSKALRNQYRTQSQNRVASLKKLFGSNKVDCIEIQTGKDYIFDLVSFFHTRHKRR